jgi:hypothetical protein
VRIAGFLADLRKTAEQFDRLEKWYRILSEALRHFLERPLTAAATPTQPRLSDNQTLKSWPSLRSMRDPTAGFRIIGFGK